MPLLAIITMGSVVSRADTTNPTPTREYVVADYAHLLDDTTRQMVLNQEQTYQKTAAKPQIVLMTVKSTGHLSIDDYTDKLLDNARWKFGKKGLDNGVLIIFAQNHGNNNVRISTGYGVEDILPDAKTNQILQAHKADLKSSNPADINRGLQATFQQVAQIVTDRYAKLSVKEAQKKAQANQHNNTRAGIWLGLIVLLVAIAVVILWIRHSNDDNNHHHDDYGSGSGGSGWSSFLLGGLIGSLLSSGGSRGGSYDGSNHDLGGFGDNGDFGDGGGFGDSGGGGDFGGGGSSI